MAKLPTNLDTKTKVIESLVNAIFKYPEERIGQILDNSRICSNNRYPDLFCIEDKKLLGCINKRLEL